jgi:purine-nucleoside phosphorylase
VKVGTVFSADLFYSVEEGMFERMARYGMLGVEMEAAGLYGVAAENGARALALLTVSDHVTDRREAEPRRTRDFVPRHGEDRSRRRFDRSVSPAATCVPLSARSSG